MASGGVCNLPEENNEGSNETISNSGASAEPNVEDKSDERGFTQSSPPVLEPSKDESRRSERRTKSLLGKLSTRSCPEPSTKEISITSSSESHVVHEDEPLIQSGEHRRINEQQRDDEPRINYCAAFIDCYNNNARKIRNSRFIYVFMFFIGMVCISAIVMGIIYFKGCEGHYPSTGPVLNIIMGLFGLFITHKWLDMVCCQRSGERYWNHEKNKLAMFLLAFFFIMVLEFMFFTLMTPVKQLQDVKKVKCIVTYYDYLYYMHIVNAGSLTLAALLYLPDSCIYIFTYKQLVPSHRNGHFQPL